MSDVKPVAYFVTGMPSGEPTLCFPDETEDCDVASDGRAKFLPLYSEGTITALQAEIEALRKDAERMDWVQRNLLAVDFEYAPQGNEPCSVLILTWPGSVGVGKNMRTNIDAAIAKEK